MNVQNNQSPMSKEKFHQKLLDFKSAYHLEHPFQKALHAGELSYRQVQLWVANRFYYQNSLPLKDAALCSKCPDRKIRQIWVQRILDQDGILFENVGGIAHWIQLGAACGLSETELLSEKLVFPGVRFAVDAYVNFVRLSPWQEGLCSSLTELFAPTAHRQRFNAFLKFYPWISEESLTYFKSRPPQVERDVKFSLEFVLDYFSSSLKMQERALEILKFKLDVLWALLDGISLGSGYFKIQREEFWQLSPQYRLQWEEIQQKHLLLFPEGMVTLNETAGFVLDLLCHKKKSWGEVITEIENQFETSGDIKTDVLEFLKEAHTRGWITTSH